MAGFTIRGTDSQPLTDVTFVPVIRTVLWTVRTKNAIIVSFYTVRLVFLTLNFSKSRTAFYKITYNKGLTIFSLMERSLMNKIYIKPFFTTILISIIMFYRYYNKTLINSRLIQIGRKFFC